MPASDISSPLIPRRTKEAVLPDKTQVKKWTRQELEDRFYQMCEDNLQLKMKINEQDEQLRKHQRSRNLLATKLLRMNKQQTGGVESSTGGGGMMTKEAKVDMAEIHNYIFELEQQNMLLRDKLKSAKYQLNAYTRFPLAPGPGSQRYGGGLSGRASTKPPTSLPSPAVPDRVEMTIASTPVPVVVDNSLLRQAEGTLGKQRQTIVAYEAEISQLKQQIQMKEMAFEEELSRLQGQITSEQRSMTTENIEIIRMQKIVRDQANEMSVLQVRANKYEMELRNYKSQHQNAQMELDQCRAKLNAEQTINSQIQTELRTIQSTHNGSSLKLGQEVETLKRENDLLKDANEKILASAFNVEREKQWESTEKSLRMQIATLEAAVKADAATRNEILEKLAGEISGRDEVEKETRKLQIQNVQLKAEIEHVQQKLNKLTTAQNVEYAEIEEALAFVRQKKRAGENLDIHIPDFVAKLSPEPDTNKDAKSQLASLQLHFAETMQELEKTRNMLLIQYKINQDFKMETDEIAQRSERSKEEYERKMKEYSEILDERALRIQKLERQLYDLAYGSKAQQPGKKDEVDISAMEPGRNLLELHLSELKLTDDALQFMQTPEPNTFLTIEFYDFEIQFTPMLDGPRTPMDFTCQYNVIVNDLFLHYMQTECAHVELHQAVGSHYKTWAAGKIYVKDLLDQSRQGKLFGSAELFGINTEALMVAFGEIRFSVQLHVPAERALKFYKDRVKSLGYIVENDETTASGLRKEKSNQLHIQIHRCRDLRLKSNGDPPSIYAAYHFFEFPDHDSSIAAPSTNPELSDRTSWPVTMDKTMDEYLRGQVLRVYLLDDSAPDDVSSYVGHVDVPLLPLAHDKPINGTFRLMSAEVETSGSVDISLQWQFPYVAPPQAPLAVPQPILALPPPIELPTTVIPQPPKVTVEAQKAPLMKPMVLPEPSLHQESKVIEDEDRTIIEIDRNGTTAIVSSPKVLEEPPTKKLERSATFEKDLNDRSTKEEDLPRASSRKTWEKKPPTAPRRGRNGKNANQATLGGPDLDESTTQDESDSEIVMGTKPSKPWPELVFDIRTMHLPEHSPILADESVRKVFLDWTLLDLPPDECETPHSFEKPREPFQTVGIDFHKTVSMNQSRGILLKDLLSAHENLVLTLISDPGEEGECVDLGTATIDISKIAESGNDLDNAPIDVVSSDGLILAILTITLKMIEAIRRVEKL